MTKSSAVCFRSVSQAFAARDGSEIRALDRLDLTVPRGQFLAIVGPSGCGKSTALRLLAGLEAPTVGTITVNGMPAREMADLIGFVFQRPTLLEWMTIEENVLLPIRVKYGRASAADREEAHRLLDLVGLGKFASKHPGELSGGMQQRASICRALIQDPDILLMDEPFGALDALTREEMCLELSRLFEKTAKTIIFVTHSIPEATLLADRVAVMAPRPGRIIDLVEVSLPRPRSIATLMDPNFHLSSHRIRNGIYGTSVDRSAEASSL